MSTERPKAPPTSRLGRLAKLAALAPKSIPLASQAMKRAIGMKPAGEKAEREEQVKLMLNAKSTAEAMLKTLGDMKGLPLKFGQMASYIDGLAPPGYEDKFQEVLKKLQSKAPPLSKDAAIEVIQKELGAHPAEIFAEWEEEPFAAASIGQVHRATTKGGERVAVKVQYPGIDKAIENDLKSLSLLETMIAPIGRKYHTKETLDEVKAVFLAELDYAREAESGDLFRKVHAGDPNVVIPNVVHSLTTRRVLTAEFIEGMDYSTFIERASQEDKNEAGKTIWRFMYRSLYAHGLLYADPHPGNYRFLGGGRVAFLDFGCLKILPPPLVGRIKDHVLSALDNDWETFDRLCVEHLGFDDTDTEAWDLHRNYVRMILTPISSGKEFKHTKEFAREAVAFLVRNGRNVVFKPGEVLPNLPKPIHIPTDMTFMNRLQWGLTSVLAGLEAEANFSQMTEPWLRAPVLPLPK